jgi:hypothetical protein
MRAHQRLGCIVTLLCLTTSVARSQVTYQIDGWPPPSGNYEIFNNSAGAETEDDWVANSFQAVANGNRINSLTFLVGSALTNRSVTVALYTGNSLTNPAGLSRIAASTNTVNLTSATGIFQTIPFAQPIDLAVGQIFYAAILMPGVPGNLFPYSDDHFTTPPSPTFLQRSFFDVGPTQGAPYNLDDTSRATLMGGTHPVVGGGVQSAANIVLRVNGSAIPEPASMSVLAMAVLGVAAGGRRRR